MSDDPLDQINRFVISIAAMVVIFVALVVALLAWGAPDESIDRISDFAGWLRDNNDQDTQVIITLGAVVTVLLMMIVIVVELTASPTQVMRVRTIKSGGATITTSEIADRIESEAKLVTHVADAQATVAARGKRVEVVLDLHVGPGADLAKTADEACRRAHVLVEEQMGIGLATRPRARLHYRELRLGGDGKPGAPRTDVKPAHESTGCERPGTEGERDERGNTGAPEAS
jgi:hypothetical protein